ncbi:MAG: hypothetical protein ACK587_07590 [Cyanobacteriota bacterium]|jgi:hypothetical protein
MTIILFGSNNPTGAAFLDLCSNNSCETWGRKATGNINTKFVYCDLSEKPVNLIKPMDGVVVSFAPIWLLSSFLSHLFTNQPQSILAIKGIIACSSSSYMTKRFAFNQSDKELSKKLHEAHMLITRICREMTIPLQILAPTLVYGKVNGYCDKNIHRIIKLMRISPLIILPKTTGLRQPIHATQLAQVAYKKANKISAGSWCNNEPAILTLGGDSILSYKSMLLQIKRELVSDDQASHCLICTIPDKMFFILIIFLLPLNPKFFEAIMRIQSDLSSFTMAHKILEEPARTFPVHPLPI